MCTVTFIPAQQACCITSSRDENISRQKALSPAIHEYKGVQLLYPKDAKADGSWIACTPTGNAAVLLNGAFVKHISMPPYRKSRGIIFLDIIAHPQPDTCFLEMDLEHIEPFTLVLFIGGSLLECRWDGADKYLIQLDETKPHIWSSATLYEPAIAAKRKQWLQEWLVKSPVSTTDDMFKFHQYAGDGDSSSDVLMKRDNGMLTVSITGIEIHPGKATMQHLNLADKSISVKSIQIEPTNIYS